MESCRPDFSCPLIPDAAVCASEEWGSSSKLHRFVLAAIDLQQSAPAGVSGCVFWSSPGQEEPAIMSVFGRGSCWNSESEACGNGATG